MVRSVAKPRVSNHEGESMTPSILRKLQPHCTVSFRVLAPALAHLHEQEQMHLGFNDTGNVPARGFANCLDRLPALAEDNLTLAFPFHVDRLLDADVAAAQFLPRFGFDRRMVWQFLVQSLEQFLTRDF